MSGKKNIWIGLGVGCGALIILAIVGVVGAGVWFKHKLGGTVEAAKQMNAQKKELTKLDQKYPFTAPADGAPLALTKDRLEVYLAIRGDALPVYKDFEAKTKAFNAAHQHHDGDASMKDVSAAFEGVGMLSKLMTQLRATYIASLDERHMSPKEFSTITGAIYGAEIGAGRTAERAAITQQLAQIDAQIQSAPTPEAKQALEQAKQMLEKEQKNMPSAAGDAQLQANAALIAPYKDQIDKVANPAFDVFVTDADGNFAKQMQAGAGRASPGDE